MDAVAQRVAEAESGTPVRCAFLELTAPDLPTAGAEMVALGLEEIRVLPMFLGVGRHAREDLPLLMDALRQAHPQVRWVLQPTVGEDPRLLDLLADLALAR
jgi:sirohydrochlorin cobaltochelatase